MQKGFKKLISNQKGGVSIYISMAIMAVLMLITLSFATVMAQNYEQTADSQLNTQAFYAAETGIADARARLLGLLDAYGRGDNDSLPAELVDIDDSTSGTGLLDALSVSTLPSDLRAIDTNADGTRIIFKSDSANPLSTSHEPKIYVFNEVTGGWNSYSLPNNYASNVTANFGQEIVLNGDCLYVSDPQTANGGIIYSYNISGSTTPPSASNYSTSSSGANLGFSFAVSADGQWLAVGSPGANSNKGKVNIVSITPGCNILSTGTTIVHPTLVIGDRFGEEVTFSGNDRIAVSAPQAYSNDGAVYVYEDITTTPALIGGIIKGQTSSGEQIGKALSLEGDTLAIGVPSSDKVYIYEYGASNTWEKNSTLNGSSGEFGDSLALENGFLAIGAPSFASGEGKVYIHQYKDDSWQAEIETFKGQSPTSSDSFGQPVILRGRNLTVGTSGSGKFRFAIDAFVDLDIGELVDRLAAACVNKKNDGTDFYNFDLVNEDEIYYSCLDIDLAPEILYYSKIEQDRSLGILLKSIEPPSLTPPDSYDDRDLESLVIQWVNSGGSSAPPLFDTSSVYPDFPPDGSWNYDAPVLEVQITAMNRDQGYTRQDLIDHTKVVYLYPSIATPYENHKDWDNIESGAIIPARCNSHLDENDPPNTVSATGNCTVVLKDLMADISPDPYHSTDRIIFSLRVRSLYGAAHLTIRGYSYQYTTPPTNSSARNSNLKIPADRRVRFRDIQAVISATGHAGDVQVRLEERFRLQPVYDYPEYGINSAQTICKIFISDQDTGTDVTGDTLADPPTGVNILQECQPF